MATGYGPETGLTFNRDAGGWLHTEREKDFREGIKRNRRKRSAAESASVAPIPSAATTTGAMDMSGLGVAPVAPVPTPTAVAGGEIPSWYIANAYQNPNEQQSFANAANALLPTLSPEDQRSMASYLATNFKDTFGGYANANFGPIPTQMGSEQRNKFLSPARAQMAKQLLDRMRTASKTTESEMGAGYSFLSNAINLINQHNSSGPMTREQYAQFTHAIGQLTAQAGKDISAYSNLAQMFNLPGFSAGPIVNNAPAGTLNV